MFRYISKSIAAGGCLHRPDSQRCVRLLGVAATATPDGREATPNHFDVLGVDCTFTQSSNELKSKYRRLMAEFHPDRHASSSEEEKALKASMATDVTRAYSVIEDDLSRALYLLELHGAPIGESDSSIVDNSLLLEIMEAREEVDDSSSDDELRPLLKSCQEHQSELCQELAKAFREERIDDAKYLTAKLQYWNRIEETILDKITSVA
ncbi:hypothetical protein ACHAXR_012187 [Thalassiosira sp. AJA248-18]